MIAGINSNFEELPESYLMDGIQLLENVAQSIGLKGYYFEKFDVSKKKRKIKKLTTKSGAFERVLVESLWNLRYCHRH